jgi:hypothetical protein
MSITRWLRVNGKNVQAASSKVKQQPLMSLTLK